MEKEQVYYDPRIRVLFTVKRQLQKYVVVGGLWSSFLNDVRTSYIRHRITNAYFKGCQTIDESSNLLVNEHGGFKIQDKNPHEDSPFKRVDNSPNFKYLKESDKIVQAHRDNYPRLDY